MTTPSDNQTLPLCHVAEDGRTARRLTPIEAQALLREWGYGALATED